MSRNGLLPQVAVNRLVRQIGVLRPKVPEEVLFEVEPEPGPEPWQVAALVSDAGCNAAEILFLMALSKKKTGAKAYRAGWPDFLVEHEGSVFAVEVKAGADTVSRRQRIMFAALERAGIRTLVWYAKKPHMLTPWRRFAALTEQHAERRRVRRHERAERKLRRREARNG